MTNTSRERITTWRSNTYPQPNLMQGSISPSMKILEIRKLKYWSFYIPQTELALWVSSAIKGWWRSAGRARLGGSAIFFLSQTFCKHRRFLPYFLRQRGGSSTTRAAATATCLSPMSIKRLSNYLFHICFQKIPKNVINTISDTWFFVNGRNAS